MYRKFLPFADVVITVCGHADELCPVLPPPVKKIHWPLTDPAKTRGTEDKIMSEFRATRNEVIERVRELLVNMLEEVKL